MRTEEWEQRQKEEIGTKVKIGRNKRGNKEESESRARGVPIHYSYWNSVFGIFVFEYLATDFRVLIFVLECLGKVFVFFKYRAGHSLSHHLM